MDKLTWCQFASATAHLPPACGVIENPGGAPRKSLSDSRRVQTGSAQRARDYQQTQAAEFSLAPTLDIRLARMASMSLPQLINVRARAPGRGTLPSAVSQQLHAASHAPLQPSTPPRRSAWAISLLLILPWYSSAGAVHVYPTAGANPGAHLAGVVHPCCSDH